MPVLEITADIVGISNLGQGFALNDSGKKIFIFKTVPGDKVKARITKENSKFIAADLLEVINPSPNRQNPPCQYFSSCGGCQLQHLKPDYYRNFKQKSLADILTRAEINFSNPIDWLFIGENSRRRVNFHVDGNNFLGFFKEHSKDLVEVERCLILEKAITDLIPNLQTLLSGLPLDIITQISVTKFDNGVAIIFHLKSYLNKSAIEKLVNFVKANHIISLSYKISDDLTNIYQIHKPQLFFDSITLDVAEEIFLQASWEAQKLIIQEIQNFSRHNKINNIVDLYCGVGTYSFALIADNQNYKISAFEGSAAMVESINYNITRNHLNGQLKANLRDLVKSPLTITDLQNQQLAIVNPPRNGAESQVGILAKAKISNIIYISCNPQAFSKDAKILLQNGYKISKLKGIDQFSYSHHIELLAIFEKSYD